MGKVSELRGLVRGGYKDLTLKTVYPDRYRAAVKKAPVVRGKVVFLEVREASLSDNFRVIASALEKRGSWQTQTVCIREGMENQLSTARRCLEAIPKLADAEFIFVSESSYFLSCLPIRPETTVIQVWHACGAFKKFGWSAVGLGFGTTAQDLMRYPVHGNFDYVTVSAPEVVWAYAEAFHMEERVDRILPIGVSRTDKFFRPKFRTRALERFEKALPMPLRGRRVILYAPTFRGQVAHAAAPPLPDLRVLREKLGGQYVVAVKQHPFVRKRPEIPENVRDFAADLSESLPIEDLLTAADVLVTDYSSVIFEYSLFERPMIFYVPDLRRYTDERGFYYPLPEMMPGPVARSTRALAQELQSADGDFDLARVRAFKYRFMSACDGHATGRVLKLMERVREEKEKEKG